MLAYSPPSVNDLNLADRFTDCDSEEEPDLVSCLKLQLSIEVVVELGDDRLLLPGRSIGQLTLHVHYVGDADELLQEFVLNRCLHRLPFFN